MAKSCPALVTPRTVACQTPLSMGFSRREYWNGLPVPSPGELPNPGIESTSLASPVLTSRFFTSCQNKQFQFTRELAQCNFILFNDIKFSVCER